MKTTIVMVLFSLLVSNVSFAQQVDTDCIAMRESNSREVDQEKVKAEQETKGRDQGSQAVSQ